jgi:hypothetical protein
MVCIDRKPKLRRQLAHIKTSRRSFIPDSRPWVHCQLLDPGDYASQYLIWSSKMYAHPIDGPSVDRQTDRMV